MKLITKVILLIVALMTPVIALYALSHQQSTRIVEEQITIAGQNRLGIFMHQIEETMKTVSSYTNLIAQDPDFATMAGGMVPHSGYEYAVLLDSLQGKLRLFSLSTSWMNRINLYFPGAKQAVSSYDLLDYDESYLIEHTRTEWSYRTVTVNGIAKQAFTRSFIEPASAARDVRQASMIVEVHLMADNIVSLLDSFKTRGNNDPFLYKRGEAYLLNGSADEPFIRRLVAAGSEWDSVSAGKEGVHVVTIGGERYLVYVLTSDELHWTLVDYVPLEEILLPVNESRNLFYLTAGLLILTGAGAAWLIYSQVQVPIRLLGGASELLERGELSVRIPETGNRDFVRLFRRFNLMAAHIQHLIEKVYREELRAKDAVMRQLQAQINPHFLYNSLAYIVSMAQMNRTEPVVSMAYSLADYYRYTTRSDKADTSIEDELAFVVSYIEIMDMQLRKIRCEIDVPPELEPLRMPRLLLQPLVENAIMHGLEPKLGPGTIRIEGRIEGGTVRLSVEDDGIGMPDGELERLAARLERPEPEGESIGLWNVHQRVRHRFGPGAGLSLTRSASGGVRSELRWQRMNAETEEGD